jgi:AraC family transcriptional regulator
MEEHLTDKIEMEELSRIAYLSPFYFQRLFNRLVGKTVMEYIKLRRLANAADYLILNRESRIKDVAYQFGFENHETFTRAFKSVYGMTPESYRSEPRQLAHFHKPDLSMTYQVVDENMPLIADGITLEISQIHLDEARFFCGLSIQHPVGDAAPSANYSQLAPSTDMKNRRSASGNGSERRQCWVFSNCTFVDNFKNAS